MSDTRSVYLDHAASTPMHPKAIEAMTAALAAVGNASSLHTAGRAARRRVEEAREVLAARLGARPSEVIFTAGGTDSDNLASRRRFVCVTRCTSSRTIPQGGAVGFHTCTLISYV